MKKIGLILIGILIGVIFYPYFLNWYNQFNHLISNSSYTSFTKKILFYVEQLLSFELLQKNPIYSIDQDAVKNNLEYVIKKENFYNIKKYKFYKPKHITKTLEVPDNEYQTTYKLFTEYQNINLNLFKNYKTLDLLVDNNFFYTMDANLQDQLICERIILSQCSKDIINIAGIVLFFNSFNYLVTFEKSIKQGNGLNTPYIYLQ